MSISLKQFDESTVLPEEDAKLFNFMIGDNTSGIVEGAQVTFLGANKLKVSAGWGICQGRMFVIEEETISAKVSANGELQGRIIINIDTSAESPISFVTQAEKSLPQLTEEDLNHSGTIYQIPLATYTVNEILISDLKDARKIIKNNIETVKRTADNAMPKSGGRFTDAVYANSGKSSSSCLRNIQITDSADTPQSTGYIKMVRK